MAFYLNRSNSNGIPDDIYQVIMASESEIKGNWRISLISDPQNDIWHFKLGPEGGSRGPAISYRDIKMSDLCARRFEC